MNSDDQLKRMFEAMEFRDEPPMASAAVDDVRRGQRYVRRRKAATWSSGVAGVAALATAGALALPGDAPAGGPDLQVADDNGSATGSDDGSSTAGETTATSPDSGESDPWGVGLGFDATRQLLLDTAAQHLDPDRVHLPEESTNTGSGRSGTDGWSISTKLDWTVPGESGLGMVEVGVTTPGYVSSDEHALGNFAANIGCDVSTDTCTEQVIQGTDETAWVAEEDRGQHKRFSVIYEREDGSLTGIGVYDLFGNNSLEPVSEVDVSLEQAFGFVTDPTLRVDAREAERADAVADEGYRQYRTEERQERDFSSTKQIPAPDAEKMSDDDVRAGLAYCTDGVPEWEGFEPVVSVRADVDADPSTSTSWIVAERGDTKMHCSLNSSGDFGGAGLFGSPDVKDAPYMRGPVEAKMPDFGLYADTIDRVTVQQSGGPEQDAIMRDGYWFLPVDENDTSMVALRGYDAHGTLVYDSTEDDAVCYTDPEGTEVIIPAPDDEDVAPEDCRPMVEWGH